MHCSSAFIISVTSSILPLHFILIIYPLGPSFDLESPWTPDYPHTLSRPYRGYRGYNDWSGRTEQYKCGNESDYLDNNNSPYEHQEGSHYLELRRRKQREREKEKAKERDRERERERERGREREREKEKEKERERERERELDRLQQLSLINHPFKASASVIASGTSNHWYPNSPSASKYHTQPLSPYNPMIRHNVSPPKFVSADRYRNKNLDLDLDSSISDR